METCARIIQFPHRTVPERWLTKKEIAVHVGYSVRWVEYRVLEGMPCRRFGNQLRFRVSEVEAWLLKRARSA
jgi:predicted DNA-binding transcriptional regulator AlpA